MLKNKLGLTDFEALCRAEEMIGKKKAVEMFDSFFLEKLPVGTFKALAAIHLYLFSDIYDFAGTRRTVDIAKNDFLFAPVLYLENTIAKIEKMPQSTFDEIVEKYVEMNVAHPFREGNGRSTRLWLECIFKRELGRTIDWSRIGVDDYLSAMMTSWRDDSIIKQLIEQALTDRVDDRELFLTNIDQSFAYEGQALFRVADLCK